ncbi:MAG: hypothetical protein GY703_05045, partial [Gammaproteobacteria bacterium]|nr:hypothetical protein [Gammaproteobacteria bacterium]
VQGELRNGTHYSLKGGMLYLHLESAYDSFRKHCKLVDYDGEVVDLKALKRYLLNNSGRAIKTTRYILNVANSTLYE